MTTLADLPETERHLLKTLLLIAMTSRHPPEAATAMAKFTHKAKARGIDPHTLVGGMMSTPSSPPQRSEPPAPPAPKTSMRTTDRGYEIDSDEMEDLAGKIRATITGLAPIQDGVLTTLEDRAFKFPTVFISFAQMNVLQPMVRAMKARRTR